VQVAVIDSGINAGHRSLGGRIAGYVSISRGADGRWPFTLTVFGRISDAEWRRAAALVSRLVMLFSSGRLPR
jgi:hypothetical protein